MKNTDEPITLKGKASLDEQLDNLIKVEREQIKISLAEARALGDLKENAEYHSAKEKQALNEGKIAYLQNVLSHCNVFDITKVNSDTIVFGATIKLVDVEKDKEVTYQIVGKDEADLKNNKISYNSPLGKALLGKEEGDTVIVKAPKGDLEYEVEEISYL